MPKTTEQVEGGGSKVAWPTIKAARQRPGDRPLIDSTGRKPHGWKRIETEPYIPVSALLSDEVKRAVAEVLDDEFAFEAGGEAVTNDAFAKRILQAAIDHLGGTDAH
jgi:hypothetical protein